MIETLMLIAFAIAIIVLSYVANRYLIKLQEQRDYYVERAYKLQIDCNNLIENTHIQIAKNKRLEEENKRYREAIEKIKKTSDDYRAGHLLDIQDSFFVDEIIAIINKLEESE